MQPAYVEIGDRPGFAKRAGNFDEVCRRAENWTWRPEYTISRIRRVVLCGTPELSAPARLLLLYYVERLNERDLAANIACVWPSAGLTQLEVGLSESQVRAHRRALEAAGYLIRDYSRANRPAYQEATDLGPLLARLPELEDAMQGRRAEFEAERALQRSHVVAQRRTIAQALESHRLEQTQTKDMSSVQRAAAPPARLQSPSRASHDANRSASTNRQAAEENRSAGANGSPRRARGFAEPRPRPSVTAEMVREELGAALELSPRVRALVPPALISGEADAADLELLARKAAALLPDPKRNNAETFKWAYRRHGVRAFTLLALAIEDPGVKDPGKWFGWAAKQDVVNPPDYRVNLRILAEKRARPKPPQETIPNALLPPIGADDERWQRISSHLVRLIGEGKFGAWFSRCGFLGIRNGVLELVPLTDTALKRIQLDHLPDLLKAAEAAGEDVHRVALRRREDC